MKKTRRRQTDLPKHIAHGIRDAWPDDVIDVSADWDEAPFWEVHPKLQAALSHVRRSAVFYQREPEGGPKWGETSNPDADPPDWHDESRSYCLFFVSSTGERLKFASSRLTRSNPTKKASSGVFRARAGSATWSPSR